MDLGKPVSSQKWSWAPKCLTAQALMPLLALFFSCFMSSKSSKTQHLTSQLTLSAPTQISPFLLNSSLIYRLLCKEAINKLMFLDDIPFFKSNFRQQQYHVSKDNSPQEVKDGGSEEIKFVM